MVTENKEADDRPVGEGGLFPDTVRPGTTIILGIPERVDAYNPTYNAEMGLEEDEKKTPFNNARQLAASRTASVPTGVGGVAPPASGATYTDEDRKKLQAGLSGVGQFKTEEDMKRAEQEGEPDRGVGLPYYKKGVVDGASSYTMIGGGGGAPETPFYDKEVDAQGRTILTPRKDTTKGNGVGELDEHIMELLKEMMSSRSTTKVRGGIEIVKQLLAGKQALEQERVKGGYGLEATRLKADELAEYRSAHMRELKRAHDMQGQQFQQSLEEKKVENLSKAEDRWFQRHGVTVEKTNPETGDKEKSPQYEKSLFLAYKKGTPVPGSLQNDRDAIGKRYEEGRERWKKAVMSQEKFVAKNKIVGINDPRLDDLYDAQFMSRLR